MKDLLKTISPIAYGLISFSAPLFAQTDVDMRLSKIESQLREASTSNARGTYGAKTADASPNIDGYGFYISADAVIYQLQQQNNTYAVATDFITNQVSQRPSFLGQTVGATEENTYNLTNYSSSFDWDFGFKVGLGYYSAHDNWQSGFNFTYLKTITRSHIESAHLNPSENVLPNYISNLVYLEGADLAVFSQASDYWHVNYYNLDWKIGRDFFVSKYLSFLPEVGIKSSWFYQSRNLNYSSSAGSIQFYNDDDFVGVGPKADVVAKLWLGKNFSLFATIDSALLFASNKVSNYSEYAGIREYLVPTGFVQAKHKYNQVTPYFGYNLGFAYDTNFHDDAFNFGIKLSYEQNVYFDASRLYNYDAPTSANISMQGIDLSFLFSF